MVAYALEDSLRDSFHLSHRLNASSCKMEAVR